MQSQSPNKNAQGVGGIINPPPGLAPPIINNNIDDDEYEEEMVSLGLSRDSGSFLASINSKDELDESISSNTTANNLNPPPGISLQPPVVNNNNMVGMNRKSAFPATPAAGVANNNSRIQRVGNNAGAPIVRRTPGPMSAAHQARHRRTPGPPGKHQQYTVSTFISIFMCLLWWFMASRGVGAWGYFLIYFLCISCVSFVYWQRCVGDCLVCWLYILQL